MKQVEEKDSVTIVYTGKLDTGDVFATVTEENPFIATLGDANVPPTLAQALLGMSVGQKKTVRVPPEEGFGPRRKDLLHTLSRKSLGTRITPKPGMILSVTIEKEGQNHQIPATVIEVGIDKVVVDYNHPLAGHHLTYDFTVVAIERAA